MLNKFFKKIHNKYSHFFKFIFFLRYLVAIFFVSISLFLIIPTFFDYKKKEDFIINYLVESYDIEIVEYKTIKYKAFPVPRLLLGNVRTKFIKSNTNLNVNNLEVYPKILSIYNLNHFEARKIIFYQNTANLKISNFQVFIEQLLTQKKKISFNNLNLRIFNDSKLMLKIQNIFFSNFGYKKNLIKGKVFEKIFKAKFEDNLGSIKFRLLNSGISIDVDLDKKKRTGTFKSKILNTNLKFNFKYNNEKLKIFNSFFRSKNLSFTNETLITFAPFLDVNTTLELEEFNSRIVKKFNFAKILEFKDSFKKINGKNTLTYKPRNFSKSIVDDLKLQVDLAYGRLNFKKNFSITKNIFKCEGNLNIIEEYPLLYFDCSSVINDKKKLLKKFSINTKSNKDILRLKVKGKLNILNKKISFDKVSLNKKNSSKEDLNYFKNSFENILFNKSFLEIFELKKIKNFVVEII